MGGWIGSVRDPRSEPLDYLDEDATPGARRMIGHIENQRALIEILGAPIYLDTFDLPDGPETLPRFRWDGAPRLWSLWAPQRALLIDIFTRALPSEAELDAKDDYARAHGCDYFYIAPGHILDFDSLRALLRERAA